ncbi:MAG: helix-turn-helix domain-containing protein [Desulfovibrionaceae bacterium]|nr:helix-turn-helix domain-containing protein [Desulfovibrionaceae bacterium]
MPDTFGSRLRQVRGGISRAKLAEMLHVPTNTLGNYERDRNEPSFAFLEAFCTILSVHADWLLFGTGPKLLEESDELAPDAMQIIAPMLEADATSQEEDMNDSDADEDADTEEVDVAELRQQLNHLAAHCYKLLKQKEKLTQENAILVQENEQLTKTNFQLRTQLKAQQTNLPMVRSETKTEK